MVFTLVSAMFLENKLGNLAFRLYKLLCVYLFVGGGVICLLKIITWKGRGWRGKEGEGSKGGRIEEERGWARQARKNK